MAHYPPLQEGSFRRWTGFRSEEEELSAVKRWEEAILPSRQRGLTPSQRQDLADLYRQIRRQLWEATQAGWRPGSTLPPVKDPTKWHILRR